MSFFQHDRYLKEITLCSVKSVLTGAHLSTLVLTASEYPVTTEVIYFYFHPASQYNETSVMHFLFNIIEN
jgi:hypothetical protein